MDKNIKNLVKKLLVNMEGLTEVNSLNLPIESDGIKIECIDAKVFVTAPDKKVSYFFTQGKYLSNLERLRRIMYIYGIELFGDSTIALRTFKKEIVEKLKEKM